MTSRWDHGGKTRQQRGYGRAHETMRAHLMTTVVICEECRRANPPRITIGTIADHIIPLAKGGTGDRSNYQLLCDDCGREKDARDRGRPLKPKLRIGLDGFPVE
jgi:5-methylcytosine-specific restriction enzyme A